MKKDFLDSIDVKAPCQESWEEMTGNEQVRFCSHCAKDVHDLSSMTRAAAERLVVNSNGKPCVRYVKTPQGKIVTAPPALTQIKRQARVAGSVLAATLALSTLAYAQGEPIKQKENWTQTVKKLSKTGETENDFSTISGTVTDANGAVIPQAKVTLRDISNQKNAFTITNVDGVYEFVRVEPNSYEIEIEYAGFKRLVVSDIIVAGNEKIQQSAVLEVAESTVGLLEITADPVETSESEINQTVQPQHLLDLPPNGRTFTTTGLIAFARPEEKPKPERPKKTKKKKK